MLGSLKCPSLHLCSMRPREAKATDTLKMVEATPSRGPCDGCVHPHTGGILGGTPGPPFTYTKNTVKCLQRKRVQVRQPSSSPENRGWGQLSLPQVLEQALQRGSHVCLPSTSLVQGQHQKAKRRQVGCPGMLCCVRESRFHRAYAMQASCRTHTDLCFSAGLPCKGKCAQHAGAPVTSPEPQQPTPDCCRL